MDFLFSATQIRAIRSTTRIYRPGTAWPILDARCFGELSGDLLVETGTRLGLARAIAERLLDTLGRRIAPAADALLAQAESDNRKLGEAAPTLAPVFAGELRCLRVIRHTVIDAMLRRLSASGP